MAISETTARIRALLSEIEHELSRPDLPDESHLDDLPTLEERGFPRMTSTDYQRRISALETLLADARRWLETHDERGVLRELDGLCTRIDEALPRKT